MHPTVVFSPLIPDKRPRNDGIIAARIPYTFLISVLTAAVLLSDSPKTLQTSAETHNAST